jgi:hypothetical protein
MPSSGFESPSLSNQAAADLRLRPHGQREQPFSHQRTKYCKYMTMLVIRLYILLLCRGIKSQLFVVVLGANVLSKYCLTPFRSAL